MTIEHDTTVTVNFDPDEAAVVIRALAAEALVQTGRGDDAREEAREAAARVADLAEELDFWRDEYSAGEGRLKELRATRAELTKALEEALARIAELEGKNDRLRSDRAADHLRRDADTLTPLDGTPADIAAHLLDRHVADPGGGQ